jgi:hypothetical protein
MADHKSPQKPPLGPAKIGADRGPMVSLKAKKRKKTSRGK